VSADRPVRLLHLTDPHLFADDGRELYGMKTAASFAATLHRALESPPDRVDAVVVTGDIADDGDRPTYERFHSSMSALGVPVFCTPGNHEDPVIASEVLNAPPLQLCGGADLGRWRVVLLSSHVPGDDSGWLADPELERLDDELAQTAAESRHALVCLHHQPLPVGSPWLDGVGLRNDADLFAVLGRHSCARAVLFGHVHQAFDGSRAGLRMLSTPSTCAQFTPNTRVCRMDLRPPGFRWLTLLASGDIETQVVWVDELRRTERPPDSRPAVAIGTAS